MIDHAKKLITFEHTALLSNPGIVGEGYTLLSCNLAKREPGTVIFPGIKDLTFEECNLVNVSVQPGWKVKDCNTAQVVYGPEKTPEEIAEEEIDIRVKNAVAEMNEVSTLYPVKTSKELKATTPKDKTEGLLSADGAGIEIVLKDGKWKAE